MNGKRRNSCESTHYGRFVLHTTNLEEIDVVLFMTDNRISSMIASVTQLRPEIQTQWAYFMTESEI